VGAVGDRPPAARPSVNTRPLPARLLDTCGCRRVLAVNNRHYVLSAGSGG